MFFQDLNSLNVIKPNFILRATENISEMVELIEKLMEKGYAYKSNDGIYFSVKKFKGYGKIANLGKVRETKSRILNDEYDKKNIRDFSLWKFYTKDDGDVFWKTNLGKGRPGWHIECSAMSMKILGAPIDIHTGGADLIFPHHTNEIAQSEAATGKKFVDYWMHGGMLAMSGGKMSKSLGNINTLRDLKNKGFSPLNFRYLCLTTHYRKPLDFDFDNLKSAKNSYERLKNIIAEFKDDKKENKIYLKKFEEAINDDLNIPNALQILWNLVRDEKAEGKLRTIKRMDEVFGLKLLEKENFSVPKNIRDLAEKRQRLREEKNWVESDKLRDEINKLGYIIEDKEEGYSLKKV